MDEAEVIAPSGYFAAQYLAVKSHGAFKARDTKHDVVDVLNDEIARGRERHAWLLLGFFDAREYPPVHAVPQVIRSTRHR